jgi:capsular exopolysaccharide synthesis family protein
MSRVFDALQEAARLRGTNNAPVEAVWTELGISATAVPLAGGDSTPSNTVPEVEAHATSSVLEMPLIAPERNGTTSPGTSLTGTPSKILLDKAARVIPHSTDPAIVERYRMLRTKILQEREKKPFRSLIITSASPQEGKTVTVLNLALSFASLPSFRVLIIDGDMRKGTLGDWLGIDRSRPGLSNLIEGSASLEQIILKSEELGIHVMPRGNAYVTDLEAAQLNSHFRRLTEQYDLVLVDTAPVNLITDVQIMAESCDAVLLIARAFSTNSKGLEEAVEKLQSFRIIGAVLNAGTPRKSRRYYGYY